MFQEMNSRLAELKNRKRQKENWEQRLSMLEKELMSKRSEKEALENILRSEQKDVDRLTGISLGALFYTLIGKKGAKLHEEEAELLQAKLRYEEAADSVTDLEHELAELNNRLREVRFIDTEIRAAMDEKKRLITEHAPELAETLHALTNSESDVQADVKELTEAISAGKSAISALDQANSHLISASKWGIYDMLGGGMISTAIKHSRIDEARSAIHAAQRALKRFQHELKDVARHVNIRIEVGRLLTFADYFFDGLITDWMVQGRIRNSQAQVEQKLAQVRRIVTDLESELRKSQTKLAELRRKREALILDA